MASPAAEVDIDAALVRGLLQKQRPDLAELPIRVVANGWDNAIVRLGDEWMVRLPRRAAAAASSATRRSRTCARCTSSTAR
jgi:hypothetical protein